MPDFAGSGVAHGMHASLGCNFIVIGDGLTDALSLPSFQSIVPSIVEHDQIAMGISLYSTQFNLS